MLSVENEKGIVLAHCKRVNQMIVHQLKIHKLLKWTFGSLFMQDLNKFTQFFSKTRLPAATAEEIAQESLFKTICLVKDKPQSALIT